MRKIGKKAGRYGYDGMYIYGEEEHICFYNGAQYYSHSLLDWAVLAPTQLLLLMLNTPSHDQYANLFMILSCCMIQTAPLRQFNSRLKLKRKFTAQNESTARAMFATTINGPGSGKGSIQLVDNATY